MPEARIDDGRLDVVVVAPRGVVGWMAVIGAVLTRSRWGHPVVEHFTCRRVEVSAEKPLHVQLDGDPAGMARVLRAEVHLPPWSCGPERLAPRRPVSKSMVLR